MQEKKKTTNNSAFYIALCCCVGIIGSVGYFTNREQKTQIPTEPKTESVAEVKVLEDPNLKEEEVKPAPTLSPVKSSASKPQIVIACGIEIALLRKSCILTSKVKISNISLQ